MSALFSVVTPAFNRASLIEETLESVWRQDHRPVEHIVVDDGSRDDTVQVVRDWVAGLANRPGYEPETYRVTLIEQDNAGVSVARNTGLDAAAGDHVVFLDSDDIMETGTLTALAQAFAEGPDMVFAGFRRFDEGTGETIMEQIPDPAFDLVHRAMIGKLWGNAGRIGLTTGFAREIGPWDTRFKLFEDREYSERAVLTARRVAILPRSIVRVRTGAGPRQNDALRSKRGRDFRIAAEEKLAERARARGDVNPGDWSAFRSRIYALSFRSYARGWREHGRRARRLADGIDAPLDRTGRARRLAARGGVIGGALYVTAGWLKARLGAG
jgi:glycosyltransferase involved in cell wall biosynthesis